MTLAKRPIDELKERFSDENLRAALVKMLPKHVSLERLCAVALNAASQNPLLLQCSSNSIIRALLAGAQLGLEPGGPLGAAYMVPYRTKSGAYEAQLIPGYRGLIELARRSGVVKHIEARCVYSMDECRIEYGLNPTIEHEPSFVDDDKLQMVYAIAILSDGSKIFEVMTKLQVEAIRARSKAKEFSPWNTDYEEMAKKTVVRRLCKYLPLSVELSSALELENNAEEGLIQHIEELPTALELPKTATQTEKIKAKLQKPTIRPAEIAPQSAISVVAEGLAMSITPAEEPGAEEVLEEPVTPTRPTIEEIKAKAQEQTDALIASLFDKLHYTDKTRSEMKLRYASKEKELIKHLEKAVASRKELQEANKE